MTRPLGDLGYAYLGWFLLTFGPVVGVGRLVAPALATGPTPFVLAGVVALPLAVGHWHAGWSVGPLGATVFWSVALWVVVGLPATLLFDVLGVDPGVPFLAVVAVVYAGAAALAVRPWSARRRGPTA